MTYMVPRGTMHVVARYLSQAIPFPYGFEAIRRMNMVGLVLLDVWPNQVILFRFIIGQAVIAILILRRQLT